MTSTLLRVICDVCILLIIVGNTRKARAIVCQHFHHNTITHYHIDILLPIVMIFISYFE